MSIKKTFFENSDIFTRIVLLLIVMMASTLIFSLFWYVFTDANPENISSLKVLQFLQSVGMFVLPPFIIASLLSHKPLKSLYLTVFPSQKNLWITVVAMLVAVPAVNLLSWLNQQVVLPDFLNGLEQWLKSSEEEAASLTEKLVSVDNIKGLIINVLLISVIPAFGEELFFRGSLFGILNSRIGKVLAVWLTAIVFSAVHFQFYGFVPRFFLAVLFGYLLVWGKSLWLPIVAHFVNNFIAVLFYYLKYNNYDVPDLDAAGTAETWWMGVLSMVITAGIIVHLRRNLKKSTSDIPL